MQPGFTLDRTFRAPIAVVWEMWTTKEGLESWWGPEGFESAVVALDVRDGGRLEIEMRAVGPKQVAFLKQAGAPLTSTERATYVKVMPTTVLEFVERFTHAPGVAPYDVRVSVSFEPAATGTRIVLHSTGMHDERWQQLASQGWDEQLAKLERVLASKNYSPSPQ
ncbi:MAG: SRPBCC family protein [Candidatus Limnocylindria bacterium]